MAKTNKQDSAAFDIGGRSLLLFFKEALLAHAVREYAPLQMATERSPVLTGEALVAVDTHTLSIVL